MSLKVGFRRPAAKELRAAKLWYERQRPGLGTEFMAAVAHVIDRVAETPEIYEVIEPHRQIRRALTRRFPYAVYYIVEQQRIVILAVQHVTRDPAVWQGRSWAARPRTSVRRPQRRSPGPR